MPEKTDNKIALVTGATGFVGSHLVRRLIKEGWKTHIITRSSSSLTQIEDVADKIIVHQHDGTTSSMINIIKDAEPDVVFHLASLFLAQHTSEDVEKLVQSNLLFGTQLAEAMTLQGVTKLINTIMAGVVITVGLVHDIAGSYKTDQHRNILATL